MYRLLITTVGISFLTGCSLTSAFQFDADQKLEAENVIPRYMAFQSQYNDRAVASPSQLSGNMPSNENDLNIYVRGMMQELVNNMQYVNPRTAMAVTSFVFLDGSYNESDIIGKQLTESFVHEVHKYGIPIVDIKATGYIRVTPDGDFVLSKDYTELDGNLPVKYVLTGTMVKQPTGYIVNARVIGLESKAIVATAQGKLPIAIVNSLLSNESNNSLLL